MGHFEKLKFSIKFWIFEFSIFFPFVELYLDRTIHICSYVELYMDRTIHICSYVDVAGGRGGFRGVADFVSNQTSYMSRITNWGLCIFAGLHGGG